MDALTGLVDSQTVLVIAAIAVLLLLVTLLLKILRANLGLILTLIAIVLGLQYFFGIDPNQLLSEIGNLPQDVMQLIQNFNAG
jgi:ABC-type multidrug transport system permease subunit